MTKKNRHERPDTRRFVQIAHQPSIGVEVSTGRAWVGVDQQVGHGSADALFGLTDEQYAEALRGSMSDWGFLAECWRGEHDDLRLFDPRGGSWKPEGWLPRRARMIEPPFNGEIWRHIDALGEPQDSERVEISQRLSGGTTEIMTADGAVTGLSIRLGGDRAYPRPAAVIAGITAGSARESVRAVLGEPVEPDSDTFNIEGFSARLSFTTGGLESITLERPAPSPSPDGAIGVFLAAIGEPEAGAAYTAAARLSGDASRRWAVSSRFRRRLLVFDGGVEMQVEDDQVLSVRLNLRAASDEPRFRYADDLIPGVMWPPSREGVRAALGTPAFSRRSTDVHWLGRCDLLVEYGLGASGEIPIEMTAIRTGRSVSHSIHRWRSGEFTLFQDIIGRPSENALVRHAGDLPGVRIGMRSGVVSEVEIGTSGYQTERFAAFIDGMSRQPTIEDLPMGAPTYLGKHDRVWDYDPVWVHMRVSTRNKITSICVREELPRGLDMRPWRWDRDR